MANTSAKPYTAKAPDTYDDDYRPMPRTTSINAHLVQSIAVTMSFNEIEDIMAVLGKALICPSMNLDDRERRACADFISAVQDCK